MVHYKLQRRHLLALIMCLALQVSAKHVELDMECIQGSRSIWTGLRVSYGPAKHKVGSVPNNMQYSHSIDQKLQIANFLKVLLYLDTLFSNKINFI